jgi:hypothetical protein
MSATLQQVPGLKRIDLQEHDLSVPGRVVIQNRVELRACKNSTSGFGGFRSSGLVA